MAAVAVLIAGWIALGVNPALADGGVWWADPAFVEQPAPGTGVDGFPDHEDQAWVAMDTADGAWVTTVVENPRPYPISVAPAEQGPAGEVSLRADYRVGRTTDHVPATDCAP